MKRVFAILILSACAKADVYISRDCPNNGDGSGWSCAASPGGAGAFNDMPEPGTCLPGGYTWIRGTYWLAGSETAYSGTCFRNVTGSGRLIVKKAAPLDHGSDTGWVASYGTQQAVSGTISLWASDVTISGSYRSGEESGHGWKLQASGDVTLLSNPNNIAITGLIVEYVEGTHTSYGTAATNGVGLYGNGSNTLRYLYLHDLSGLCFKSNKDATYNTYGGFQDSAIEESVCGRIGRTTGAGHVELLKDDGEVSGLTIKNSLWYDWRSTGGLVLSGGETNWKIYNNIFTQRTVDLTCGNGVITGLTVGTGYSGIEVYNNTFANISSSCANIFGVGFGDFSDLSNLVKNNLFFNVDTLADVCGGGCTKADNWFYQTSAYTPSGDDITGSADPFSTDYRLSGNGGVVGVGENLTGLGIAGLNSDKAGTARPTSGAWDIGAYQYSPGWSKQVTGGTHSGGQQ